MTFFVFALYEPYRYVLFKRVQFLRRFCMLFLFLVSNQVWFARDLGEGITNLFIVLVIPNE